MPVLAAGSPGVASLVRDGALMPVTITSRGGSRNTQAMIDTGSTASSVDRSLLDAVGAPRIGSVAIRTVMGREEAPVYAAAIVAADGTVLSQGLPGVIGDDLPAPVQCLIGRDILSSWEFVYGGSQGAWSLGPPGQVVVVPQPPPVEGYLLAAIAGAAITLGGVLLFGLGEKAEQRKIFGGIFGRGV